MAEESGKPSDTNLTKEGEQSKAPVNAVEKVGGFFDKVFGALQAGTEFSLQGLAKLEKGGRDLQGPLNGVFGDHLHSMQSPMALKMQLFGFREGDFRLLDLEKKALRAALPDAGERICILVHGLGSSEKTWKVRRKGERPSWHAELLGRDTGHDCYFVRYNTGRHISENGRELAGLIERFVDLYPGKLREINLIGHSMGGLVLRSASYYAGEARHAWLKKLRRTFLLGSPLIGAHQEQIGKLTTDVLNSLPLPATKIIAGVAGMRSAGIQDLGFGYLRDEDWQEDRRLDTTNTRSPVPLVKNTRYYIVHGSLSKEPESIVGTFIGDGVVPRFSARGSGSEKQYEQYVGAEIHEVSGVQHTHIPGDPRVYRRLRDWLLEPR